MAESELVVANGALMRLGADPLASLVTPVNDRTRLVNQYFAPTRKEALRSHPWNFALHRVRLNTFPQATLTASALTGTITATASAAVFALTDVGYRVMFNGGGQGRITAVAVDLLSATVELDSDITTLSFAIEEWRIAPASGWTFRYAKPTNYLRVVEVAMTATSPGPNTGPILWSWWADLSNKPEPIKVEGEYLVSNASGKLDILFIRDISDTTKWDPVFDSALECLLAFKICYGVTGSLAATKTQFDAYKQTLAEARTMDGQEDTPDDVYPDDLVSVRQ
jgi:hypothetical protein